MLASARRSAVAVLLTLMLPGAPAQAADDYPNKPVRLIVPLPPGSGGDISGRVLAQAMTPFLGQSVYVENRAGALGTVGAAAVARMAGDGYTVLFGNAATHGAAVSMFPSLAYDPLTDFTPVTLINRNYLALMVRADLGIGTLDQFIAYAKANPGKLSYGTPGTGSQHWLAGETLKKLAGIDVLHVPFQGGGGAMSSMLGGHVSAVIGSLSTGVEHQAAGKIRIVALTSDRRTPEMPDVPAIGETYPGYNFAGWWAMFGPKGMPAPVVAKLNDAALKALASPELKASYQASGFVPEGSTPAQLQQLVQADVARWKDSAFAAKP
jgi:tripartite-type tricarboxylate transporter receptor subunit TctC